jgi:reversibly glycosylated polypeptide / UDP-arabinopyranose mutase
MGAPQKTVWYSLRMKKKIYIVVPTIRNLDFLKQWDNQFLQCHLVIVEDHAKKQIQTPSIGFDTISHFSWEDIQKDFKSDEWIFSRQNAGIRSYGFWKAYGLGADVIVTLDDDCYPVGTDFIQKHVENLTSSAPSRWFTTFPHPDYMYTRGFPYSTRNAYKAVMSHGLWSNKMDMDAKTQQKIGDVNIAPYPPLRHFIAPSLYFPMSSMNLAFARSVVPLMYFPLMGKNPKGDLWGYDRFDDIWAGIFAKKIIDHLGMSVVSGTPFVEHKKASDVATNLIKEQSGLAMNEILWKSVDAVVLTKKTPAECYYELAKTIKFPEGEYFSHLRTAMITWANLFLS